MVLGVADPLGIDTSLLGNQGDASGSGALSAPVKPELDPESGSPLGESADPFASLQLPRVSMDDFQDAIGSAGRAATNFALHQRTQPTEAAPDNKRQDALALAKKYLGTWYKYGGSDPSTGFDCSGLVQYVWGKMGVHLPRVSSQQAFAGKHVPLSKLKVMDLVAFNESDIGHIALWLGNGMILEAPHTGAQVRIRKLGKGEDVFGVHLNV